MAGGGGAWKVAYADFVTAMMAFFMVMWLTSQKPEVKESLAQYFSDPWAKYRLNSNQVRKPTLFEPKAGENPPKKEWMGSHPTSVPHDEAEWPKASKPKIVTVRASERTTIGAIIQFDSGADELSEDAKLRLRKLAPQLKGLQQIVEIKAHLSTQASSMAGDGYEGWQLCLKRSLAVKQFLESQNIPGERFRLNLAGPYEPLSLEATNDPQDKNSRVEIFLMAETVEKFKGNKAERAKSETMDESKAQEWLEKHDPASAVEAKPKGGH